MGSIIAFIGDCLAPAIGIFVPLYGIVALLEFMFLRDKEKSLVNYQYVMLLLCDLVMAVYSYSKIEKLISNIREGGLSLIRIIALVIMVPFAITLFFMVRDLIRREKT